MHTFPSSLSYAWTALLNYFSIFKSYRGIRTSVMWAVISGGLAVVQVAGRQPELLHLNFIWSGGLHLAPPSWNQSPNAYSREGSRKKNEKERKLIEQRERLNKFVKSLEKPRVCIWYLYSTCKVVRLYFKDNIFWLHYQVFIIWVWENQNSLQAPATLPL